MFIILVLFLITMVVFISVSYKKSTVIQPKLIDLELVGKYMSDFEVVGVHLGERKWHIINYVEKHNPVELIPEPKNKYSSKAIMVEVEGVHVGYISESDLDEVHDIISRPYSARVLEKDYSNSFLNLTIEINHS
ncbi:hypothetical protein CJ739_61 [Mariniflexile rhizosphaerae]|uniref:HIRAN domain-containing protein n=1 Tax=unclassified Mariniflexile TaxID=2643887 RepID=UPI000E334FD5|nr:HIRAN domain-containing protein [Mariniflexile sp. TRM1-10]AXP79161.1 hypothetical protein CJ739_61 [Mariniflexile sp. TRM1-10]